MSVSNVMTENPACCTPNSSLTEVARLMVEHDCGEIPVVVSQEDPRPVGVVTDRDIALTLALNDAKPGTPVSERRVMDASSAGVGSSAMG